MTTWELEELVALMLSDNNEEKADELLDSDEDLMSLFEEKYNIAFDDFESIVKILVKYTPPIKSPLTDEIYNCFGIQENGMFRAIIKEKITIE